MSNTAPISSATEKKERKTRSLKFQFTLFFILFVIAVYSIIIITSSSSWWG
jgi:hypothetical protein